MYGGDEIGSLVADFGVGSFRLGYSGEDFPKWIESATVGKSEQGEMLPGRQQYYPRSGMEVDRVLDPSSGLVCDWSAFHSLLSSGLNALHAPPVDHPLLIVEPNRSPREERERMAAELFEREEFPALHFARSSVLSCFASGRSSALVLDCGFSHTEVAPVAEGILLNRNIKYTKFAGRSIEEIAEILFKKSVSVPHFTPHNLLTSPVPLNQLRPSYTQFVCGELLRDIRESVCRVSEVRLTASSGRFPSAAYELPDKTVFEAGNERFLIPEHYFHPNVDCCPESREIVQRDSGLDSPFLGLPSLVESCLNSCDVDLRKEFSSNLVLTGGQSLYQGFSVRLASEINLNPATKVKVVHSASNPHQLNKYLSWVGGSILSSLGTFHQMWVSKQEYQEEGNRILHKKCQ